jgi:outer membrane lipoprotein carrier protein
VVVRKMGAALGGTPAALLAGRDDVERAFAWKEAPPAGGFDWLVATPRAQDASFTEIRLGFAGEELAALDLLDAFGQRTEIRFGTMVPNPQLSPEAFRFVPPKGADVIGDR